MKKKLAWLLIMIICSASVFADAMLDKADKYYEDQEYKQGYSFLESKLNDTQSKQMQAEIYWRLSRFALYIGDEKKDAGADKKELLSIYEDGEALAQKAIDLYPGADAHYWHCSNIGRIGETKGVLNSLNKAKPMRDELLVVLSFDREYPDAFYVLSRLHFLLPGKPLSFGNKEYAASYARRAIDLYDLPELKVSYYKNLAEILWKRNWDKKKRIKEIGKMKDAASIAGDEAERMAFYEYSLGLDSVPRWAGKKLSAMSDRDEAKLIVEWIQAECKKITPNKRQLINMRELDEMIAEWD